MIIRFFLLLATIILVLSGCFNQSNDKAYSCTTYFTSFDSTSDLLDKYGQRIKYAYEEYNSDSNLLYQETYSTNDDEDFWGKLCETKKIIYNGKQKLKATIEQGICFPSSERGRGKQKVKDSFEYTNGKLVKYISNGKVAEEYKYNNNGELTEKRILNYLEIPEFYLNKYEHGLIKESEYFVADTLVSTTNLIYNKQNLLVEKNSFNNKGQQTTRRQYIRNEKGQVIEEKWREPINAWRSGDDGQIIEDEFYQINKYFYDSKGRVSKTEFYDIRKKIAVYEFEYN